MEILANAIVVILLLYICSKLTAVHLKGTQSVQFSSDQSLSCVRLCATPWIAARQVSLSSPTPRVHSNSHPLSRWCHPAISFSVVPFSSCPQFLPASKSFPMSQLITWGGQSTGVKWKVITISSNPTKACRLFYTFLHAHTNICELIYTNVETFVYINACFDYEKLIIPNTKYWVFYKNHEQISHTGWIPSLKCCTLFLVETLPVVLLQRELHSLFLQQTCWPQKTLKQTLQWSAVLPMLVAGKALMLGTGKVWEQDGFSQHRTAGHEHEAMAPSTT